MKEETELIEQISNLVEKHVQYSLEKYKNLNINSLKKSLTKHLSQYIYEKTERNPMILPVVMVV